MAGTDGQFQCPTCKYQYQLGRLTWANTLKSPIVAFFLAVSIVALSIFLLGFVADPIISLWLDPVATVGEGMGLFDSDAEGEFPLRDLDEEGWSVHFVKGMFSLGLLGFVKAFFAMGPFQWWNLRSSGVIGGGARRRGGTGRDRMENINLYLVLIGVVTFFWVSMHSQLQTYFGAISLTFILGCLDRNSELDTTNIGHGKPKSPECAEG